MDQLQLKLTQLELEEIRFVSQDVAAEQDTIASVWYSMPVRIGEFLYNADTYPHNWYFRASDTNAKPLNIQLV